MHQYFGFCVSYSEVLKYERCAAVHQGTKIHGVPESSSAEPTHFMHHVVDNADHKSRILDGRNTYHVMVIIFSVTTGVSSSLTIPRLEDVSTESDQTYLDRSIEKLFHQVENF